MTFNKIKRVEKYYNDDNNNFKLASYRGKLHLKVREEKKSI